MLVTLIVESQCFPSPASTSVPQVPAAPSDAPHTHTACCSQGFTDGLLQSHCRGFNEQGHNKSHHVGHHCIPYVNICLQNQDPFIFIVTKNTAYNTFDIARNYYITLARMKVK